jgi:hypothetical protein
MTTHPVIGGAKDTLLTGRSHDLRHSNHRGDGGDNDNKGGKYPTNSVDLFKNICHEIT